MTDPTRILDGRDELAKDLLQSALPDSGSDAALRRLQKTLLTAAGASTAALAASKAAKASTAAQAASVPTTASLLKLAAAGALGATTLIGSVRLLMPEQTPEAAVPLAESVHLPKERAPKEAAAPRRVEPELSPAPLEPKAQSPQFDTRPSPPAEQAINRREQKRADDVIAQPAATPFPAEPQSTQRLLEEARLIDAARAALAQGQLAQALSLLNRHDLEFRYGALSLEAAVLKVEALVRSGRRSEAESLGQAIVARHPGGAYASKVHRLLHPANP